ncbi:MAG: type II CAAX endopeptidase family protein [Microbacterium sp.]
MTLPANVVSAVPGPAPFPRIARPLPADATAGGLAFHRLVFARRRNGWWTPLVVGAVGVALYLAFLIVVLLGIVVASFALPDLMDSVDAFARDLTIDMNDPFIVALTLGTIVLMLPSYVLASLIVNGRRVGLVSSAAGRLRWRWMLQCTLVAVIVSAVLLAVTLLLPAELAGEVVDPAGPGPQWAATLVVVLLLVPLQAAAEEYVFRGYLMQAVGRWLRHPAFAILLPVPLFVMGHMYDVLGQIGVGLFAIAAGWLTWRTGGLEAAIALHVVNNLVGFGLSIAEGSDPTATETGIVSFLWSLLLVGGYVAIIEWMRARHPIPRTLVITPPLPPMPTGYAAAMPSASRIV